MEVLDMTFDNMPIKNFGDKVLHFFDLRSHPDNDHIPIHLARRIRAAKISEKRNL